MARHRSRTSRSALLSTTICAAAAAAAVALTHDASGQCEAQSLDPTGVASLGEYGYDVATDGQTIVVGARGDDLVGNDAGSARVYEFIGDVWTEVITLSAGDAQASDLFGQAVAVDGEWLVVGSPFDDDAGSASGAVYVYQRLAGAWTFDGKLVPLALEAGDNFGSAVAIDGTRLVIGATGDDDQGMNAGAAYVCEYSDGSWTEQGKLTASGVGIGDRFGSSVDVSGDRIVVGAPLDDDVGINSGSAYVFELDGARTWTLASMLTLIDGATMDEFGGSVSIDGDLIAVGARRHDFVANDAGAVFIFEPGARSWMRTDRIVSPSGAAGDHFGNDVSLAGQRLLVGARLDDNQGADSGSALLFARDDGDWSLQEQLIRDIVDDGDFYGWAVALSADHAIVAALAGMLDGTATGHVHVFNVSPTCQCPADLDGNLAVDIFDLLELLSNWGTGGEGAAIASPEDVVDVFDLIELLSAWGDCA